MGLYVIGDLHLSLSTNKPMDIFGDVWKGHTEKLKESFSQLKGDDTIILCGDTSWGISLDEALADFQFIDALPGKKIILKGNHDYWWETASKMNAFFEKHDLKTLRILHNNAYFYGDYAICGTRGWFRDEETADMKHNQKVLNREVMRLETSLKAAGDREILCFLHYPPMYYGYECSEVMQMLQKYHVKACYYGHLHGPSHKKAIEGQRMGINFSLIAADYLRFQLKKICE